MRAIVVYYSHDGNTDFVAKEIAAQLGAELLRLEAEKAYPTGKFSKFFWGGKSVVFNEKPKLTPYQFAVDNYDVVVLGSPVWAGNYTPPMATFLQEQSLKGKSIGLFGCHSGGGTDKCFQKYEAVLGGSPIVARLGLQDPLKNSQSPEVQAAIKGFCDELASGR